MVLADDGCLVGERTRGTGLLGGGQGSYSYFQLTASITIFLLYFSRFCRVSPRGGSAVDWAGAWMGSCFFFRGALAECSAASDRRAISVIFSSARLALCSQRLRRVLPVGGCASGHGWDGGEREGRAEWVNGTVLAGCWICGFEWSWVDDILDAVWMGEDGRVE